jgi:hypothetical protein
LLRRYPGFGRRLPISVRCSMHAARHPRRSWVECAYLAAPTARGFKRPYGWGWLLKLAAEL